jgi:hypothetical protein
VRDLCALGWSAALSMLPYCGRLRMHNYICFADDLSAKQPPAEDPAP